MERPLEDQISSLLVIWRTIVARRWMIAALVLLSVCATALKIVLEPRLYEAQVEIIALAPAWENNRGAPMGPVTSNLGKPFRPLTLVLVESIYWELYARVLAEAIAKELDLQTHYGTATMAQTVLVLEGNRSIQLTNQGTLQVRMMDRDSDMAAAIANAHARHLDRLDRRLLAKSASFRRRFIEARVQEAGLKLAKTEESRFPLWFKVGLAGGGFEQESEKSAKGKPAQGNFANDSEEEQATPLTRITRVKLQAMELEIELVRLRSFASREHPEVIRLEAQLKALHRAIDRLENGGEGNHFTGGEPSLFPSLAQLPELALPSERLAREAKVQVYYYVQWRKMLEDTIVEEALDLPRVWVLDHAVPDEHQRRLWQKVIAAGSFALVLGVLLSFLFDFIDRLRDLKIPAAPEQS